MIDITDVPSASQICSSDYDFAIFGSGSELRSINVAHKYADSELLRRSVALGHSDSSENKDREANDRYFSERLQSEIEYMDGDAELRIYDILERRCRLVAKELHLLIDYSSMSRIWYTAILNWFRFARRAEPVLIDFVYSYGIYQESAGPPIINDILALPGLEGGSFERDNSVGIFGLGFHGVMTQCVLEQLEPSTIYAYLAIPGVNTGYDKTVVDRNKAILDQAKGTVKTPLSKVEMAVRCLREIVIPYEGHSDIAVIPMGPKPQILAGIILAMTCPNVACLRVGTKKEPGGRRRDVVPSGEIAISRVTIRH